MGELESKVREYAPLIILAPRDENADLESLAKDAKGEIHDALKGIIDSALSEKAREDLQPVVEQEIDPQVYESTSYGASVSYGDTTQKVYYHGIDKFGGDADKNAYDLNQSAKQETKLAELSTEASTAARDARMFGRKDFSSELDPEKKAAIHERKMRSVAIFQMEYSLSNWQFL